MRTPRAKIHPHSSRTATRWSRPLAGVRCVALGIGILALGCGDDPAAPGPTLPGQQDAGGGGGLDAGSWPPVQLDTGVQVSPDAGSSGLVDSGTVSDASQVDSGASNPGGPFPPATDYGKDGPYKGTTMTSVGPNNGYTVYLPSELAPNGAKNPIVGWMSGGGTTHDLYPLLPRLATHGFVVVAANVLPGIGEEVNLGKQIIAGIDWAIAENSRSGSGLFGKLDTSKIASMGYSMGSLATFTIASDPRLTTTVHISGGNMAPERINNLKAPAAFICGTPGDSSCGLLAGECDLAAANCDLDFGAAKTPVFYANFTGGHLGILTPPLQDQIGTMATIWLRWKLMSDTTLAARFVGPQCSYCTDKSFAKVQQKNLQ